MEFWPELFPLFVRNEFGGIYVAKIEILFTIQQKQKFFISVCAFNVQCGAAIELPTSRGNVASSWTEK